MTKYLKVTMENGVEYLVSAVVISNSRAKYYANNDAKGEDNYDEVYKKVYKEEFDIAMNEKDGGEIMDWAANNMDWDDVKDVAIRIKSDRIIDHQEGWMNGEHEVVNLNEKEIEREND